MSSTRRHRGPRELAPYLTLAAVGTWCLAAVSTWGAAHLAGTPGGPVSELAGGAVDRAPGGDVDANPFGYLLLLLLGKKSLPPGALTWLITEALLLGVLAAVAAWTWTHRKPTGTRVDVAARHLASRRELAAFTHAGVAATAARLGVIHPSSGSTGAEGGDDSVGIAIGDVIGSGQRLYGSWEDMHVDIWGPRTGKTTSRAIPAIAAAPGAVLVTSNKRDVLDATRGLREQVGTVWVFDPQDLAGQPPTWWWNPLSYVRDVDKAVRLAGVFAAYTRRPSASGDAYFDGAGEELLAFLLLAAKEGGEPITAVYRWLSDTTDTQPVDLLRQAGHLLPAESVQGTINFPDKQRAGVYATAKRMVGCLINPDVTRWVTPPADVELGTGDRPHFDPDAVVRSRDTIYLLSREGQGTAGPLVTALTVAIIEAAEQLATHSPGGRLARPMLGCLDEAANVCRWKDLPDLYSHYGSRGIILMTILQSWAQGVEVWGEHGMVKLWSAANIRVYGGGASDPKFLSDLVQMIGEFEAPTTSITTQRGSGFSTSRSTTAATRSDRILDVADLAALPRGRALVLASGARPALVRTLPWQKGPVADQIRDSLARYAPADTLPAHDLPTASDQTGTGRC